MKSMNFTCPFYKNAFFTANITVIYSLNVVRFKKLCPPYKSGTTIGAPAIKTKVFPNLCLLWTLELGILCKK